MKKTFEKIRMQRGDTVFRRRRPGVDHAPASFVEWRTRGTPGKGHQKLVERVEQSAEVVEVASDGLTLRLAGPAPFPSLPPGYYFKGGAAREVLRRTILPGTRPMFIRDYDLVRFMGSGDLHDHELASRFMGADYQYGHGVEVVEGREEYFKTRDLTVNEVLHRDLEILCSFSAIEDLLSGRLSPTKYARDALNQVQGLTLMKALRIEAEAVILNVPLRVFDFPTTPLPSGFEIAVHLDRAFAAGEAVAAEYVFSAWQRSILMPGRPVPPTLYEAVSVLALELRKGIAFFRYLPSRERSMLQKSGG